MIKRDDGLYDDIQTNGVSKELLESVIKEQRSNIDRLNRLDDYYKGRHDILHRNPSPDKSRPNTKIIHNFAEYIVVMATGYLLGDKIKYTSETKELEDLKNLYRAGQLWDADEELAKDMSVFGRAYELLYMTQNDDDDTSIPKSHVIDPRCAFVVYGDTADRRKLFGGYYFPRYDDTGQLVKYVCVVYTTNRVYTWELGKNFDVASDTINIAEHYFAGVPVIEYANNEEATGDFEGVLSLIDAYNQLQSDRVNDVERFVQAILFLKNFTLDEKDAQMLRDKRILAANGSDTDAKWLVNALDQNGVEVLKKNFEQDIHKFSFVPSITDENFIGNASGVAMKFKLIGLSQMIKIKKRYMEKGLRERLRLILNLPNQSFAYKASDIDLEFSHSLPVNDVEIAEMVNSLRGLVTDETLLGQIPFVVDAASEYENLLKQKEHEIETTQMGFGYPVEEGE